MNAPKTTLIVIRHGETVWNREQRFQGHGDSPLTAVGRRQASALAKRLCPVQIDGLISSDLGRAVETAQIITAATGYPVEQDRRLRERHYGVLEGLNLDQIRDRYPDVFDRFYTDDPDYAPPEGESHRQQYIRNIDGITAIAKANTGGTIALVVHGGVLDSLLRFVARIPLAHPRCAVSANASLSVVHQGMFYRSHRWIIETWGDVAHLAGIGYRNHL